MKLLFILFALTHPIVSIVAFGITKHSKLPGLSIDNKNPTTHFKSTTNRNSCPRSSLGRTTTPPSSSSSSSLYGSTVEEELPPFQFESIQNLQQHQEDGASFFDTVVCGAGPGGLLLASALSKKGCSVCIVDPAFDKPWPNNYGKL